MKIARLNWLAPFLLGLLVAASTAAQESYESAPPTLPEVASLEQDTVTRPDTLPPGVTL